MKILVCQKIIHFNILLVLQKTTANVPHISRVIPARSWAGAVPTLLTHEALDTLCRPCPHPQKDIPGPELSPLERFLGCVSMRRNLQRFIQSEESVSSTRNLAQLAIKQEIIV